MPVCKNHVHTLKVEWESGPGCPLCSAYESEHELLGKVQTLERQLREMQAKLKEFKAISRDLLASPHGCTCDNIESAFEMNPHGHNVQCPLWGTDKPNDCIQRLGTSYDDPRRKLHDLLKPGA